MKPVHELTADEATAELERVCDLLMDAAPSRERCNLLARKRELEAWILMHQSKADAPVKSGPLAVPGATPHSKEAAMTTGEGKPPRHGASSTTKDPDPMPNPKRLTEEEKRAKAREYNRKWAAKKAAEVKAAKADQKLTTSAKVVQPKPQASCRQKVEVDEPAPPVTALAQPGVDRPYSESVAQHVLLDQLQGMQAQVLGITAEIVRMPTEDRAFLFGAVANLDALAFLLAQFLVTGRIEVAS